MYSDYPNRHERRTRSTTKMSQWDDNTPIYLQLRDAVLRRIVLGTLVEGEAVPSVRQVAGEEKINPLTVSKAYQLLVDQSLLEKRRGLGMFVAPGAQVAALEQEKSLFVDQEWPRIRQRMQTLGISLDDLPWPTDAGDGI